MKELLEAGVHFGHQTRRWNPKMAKYIFAERNGIYIIDLQKTLRMLQTACDQVQEIAAQGGTVLFVGTKRQSQETVKDEATRCQMFYVNHRWLGGTLTNFQTIRRSIQRLEKLDIDEAKGVFNQLPKKEVIKLRREKTKLTLNLDGIKAMKRPPDAVVITDTRKEHTATLEANKLGIPVIAIVDTNCDPQPIDLPVPGNDDAIRAIRLVCSVLATSIVEGRASVLEGADTPETVETDTSEGTGDPQIEDNTNIEESSDKDPALGANESVQEKPLTKRTTKKRQVKTEPPTTKSKSETQKSDSTEPLPVVETSEDEASSTQDEAAETEESVEPTSTPKRAPRKKKTTTKSKTTRKKREPETSVAPDSEASAKEEASEGKD